MSKNLRKGETVSLSELARRSKLSPAERWNLAVRDMLNRNDLVGLWLTFGK